MPATTEAADQGSSASRIPTEQADPPVVALFHRAFGTGPYVFSGFEHPKRRNKRPVWQVAVPVAEPTADAAKAAEAELNAKAVSQ